MFPGDVKRTVVSAMDPWRYENSRTEIFLTVWFEELAQPVEFLATPFDCERHGKYLWMTAMRGDYGPITVVQGAHPEIGPMRRLELQSPPKLLEYHGES